MAAQLGASFDTTTVVRELYAQLQALEGRVAALEAGKTNRPEGKPAGSKAPAEPRQGTEAPS
jgi:hypothetical protein